MFQSHCTPSANPEIATLQAVSCNIDRALSLGSNSSVGSIAQSPEDQTTTISKLSNLSSIVHRATQSTQKLTPAASSLTEKKYSLKSRKVEESSRLRQNSFVQQGGKLAARNGSLNYLELLQRQDLQVIGQQQNDRWLQRRVSSQGSSYEGDLVENRAPKHDEVRHGKNSIVEKLQKSKYFEKQGLSTPVVFMMRQEEHKKSSFSRVS